ncbi:hypothetical protein WJ438_30775 [Streptomyces sp. GD-15H]|uniref:hypothetical protein n=1 Tax=Streptomyces sp. GD-15H TaxID=3129112 RepID=UPI003250C94A
MRQTRIEKRRPPTRARRYADETAPPFGSLGPFDPRDPDIVRAKRLRPPHRDDHGRTDRS